MKINLDGISQANAIEHYVKISIIDTRSPNAYCLDNLTLDQIEDLEINLTDIIKKLQDYRMKQNHE